MEKFLDPIELYRKVRGPYSFLLQSGMGGRWSFIGYKPKKVFVYQKGRVQVRDMESRKVREVDCSNPDIVLSELQKLWKSCAKKNRTGELYSYYGVETLHCNVSTPSSPSVGAQNFAPLQQGGLVGFFSYDFGVKFEGIKQTVKDDVGYPEVCFGWYDKILAVDHEKGVVWGLNDEVVRAADLPPLQRNDCRGQACLASTTDGGCSMKIKSNLILQQYLSKIRKIKNYLESGDTYQVNFSQRFAAETGLDPFEIYQKVTKINPSPFQGYFEGEDFAVVSNSPERLVRVKDGIVETRPIKGTMPRGKTEKSDEKYRQKLLASSKDRAELAMIVDLARNDIGKVCKTGTVEVNEDRITEGYSHVWHTMSNVRGVLRDDKDFVEVIRSVFPGGSVTGCPKKRTMEIIDELEDFKRGVYTGSMGYIGFDGNLDFNIMIRTMFCKRQRSNWRVLFHAGGGIVVDSEAKSEYRETLDKAGALKGSLN